MAASPFWRRAEPCFQRLRHYQITIEIYIQKEDRAIMEMYPKLRKLGACWAIHTDIRRTLAAIEKCLTGKGEPTQTRLHRMYDLT